jgi:hypothetical protein
MGEGEGERETIIDVDGKIRKLTDTYVKITESYRFINSIRREYGLSPLLESEELYAIREKVKSLLFERHIGTRLG